MQASPHSENHIIGYLAGPTASGKSALGVTLALRRNLAIISADSMQVYRGLAVGTGVIPESDRQGIPHALLECADVSEEFHAARFRKEALAAARQFWDEYGRRSLVVGGTGLWIKALREGLFPGPGRDESIRRRLRQLVAEHGAEELHRRLSVVDQESARRLPIPDVVRVERAMEVFLLTGKPMSAWQAEDKARREEIGPLAPLVWIDHPREVLLERINRRVREMLRGGWIEEARWLREQSLPAKAPAAKALGYPILFDYLNGTIPLEEAEQRIQIATRQYARSQRTWFRAQPGNIPIPANADVVERAFFPSEAEDR